MQVSIVQLIEKMVRAKVKLENSRVNHKDSCPVESNPDGYSRCNCGASTANLAIDAAIRELRIED